MIKGIMFMFFLVLSLICKRELNFLLVQQVLMLKFSSNLVFNHLPIVLITCSSFKPLYGRTKQWGFLLSSSAFWAMFCYHNWFSLTSINTLNITQCGYPLILLKLDCMCFNCISRHWLFEKMSKALCTKDFIFPHFHLFGVKEFQWIDKQELVYYGILLYVFRLVSWWIGRPKMESINQFQWWTWYYCENYLLLLL